MIDRLKFKMREIDKWLLWIGLICTSWNVLGQGAHSFQYLSNQDGLSQVSVFAIAQDNAGFMWFGTKNGLNRYDGYRFKVFRKDTTDLSLPADDIRNLYADPKTNDLWIGTNYGLGKYDLNTDKITNFRHQPEDKRSLSSDVIRRVFRDSKARLWVGTSIGLDLFNEEENNFKRYSLTDSSEGKNSWIQIWSILEDSQGVLWFGTSKGLFQLIEPEDKEFSFSRVDGKNGLVLEGQHIRSLVEDEKGNFWIGTEQSGLNYWDRKNNTLKSYRSDPGNPYTLSDDDIRAMCMDTQNNLWVATFNGLNFLPYGETAFTVYKKDKLNTSGVSDNSIHSLFLDRRGSLWVGTFYGGINHLDENYNRFTNFKNIPFKNSLSADVVSSFAEDDSGNLWIGTEGGGLNFFDRKKNTFEVFQPQSEYSGLLNNNNIKKLLLQGDKLWIGTFQGGLSCLDLKDKRLQNFQNDPNNSNSLSGNNVYGIHIENERVWVLTYGKGLNIFDQEENKFYHFRKDLSDDKSISSDLVRTIIKTKDRNFWIGTEKGLNKVIINSEKIPVGFEKFLDEERIYVLQESWENKIWVGTFSNGLFYLDPETGAKEHFTTIDGLAGNSIFGIIELNDQELWLSTNKGLSKFNYLEKSFTNYDYSNGLANLEYNFNAYYKTRSGELLFGGINGFTLFDPKAIHTNEFVPPVVLTSLNKNDEVIDIGIENYELLTAQDAIKTIKFNYNEANFSISFAALDYISPENNRYAFKLEGLDRDWNYTLGKTEATYTIQRDGEYVFKLKGANSDGIWNPQEQRLKIVVLPPPWRSWWAYLIYIAVAIALSYGLFRYIRLRHKLQLQEVAQQKSDELHEMKLQFFTNITHEFRTPLTLILGPLKELVDKEKHSSTVLRKLKTIEKSTQRLLNLVNQVLIFRKMATDHEPMQLIKADIVSFLKEIFLPFQEIADLRQIDYSFKAHQEVVMLTFDADKLEKVFFNLLSNAFKFTPDGGMIEMGFRLQDQYIEIYVADNGVGIEAELHEQVFKRFYEKAVTNRSNIKGTGIGLAISKQMVELHQGKIFVSQNPYHPNFQGGATLVVQLPLHQGGFDEQKVLPSFPLEEKIETYALIPPVSKHLAEDRSIAPNLDKKECPVLLIVEDNPEIRAYIQEVFVEDYQIILAEDGQEGLEKTKEFIPQMIISDVMMPRMDGITFCRKVKTDLEISHIPIILLTARTASILKIEGLKTGADDYVTKPFNPEELRLRVLNLVQARQTIKDKFSKALNFDPSEITVTSADEAFLENAMRIAEDNIGNYEFNVIQFAKELAVSRPLLFTKLKALTGQTPNNFIKTIRLKRAAQLLKTQKLNVSQVAYKVGFKDPRYFRRCFKEQFDIPPSKYGKDHLLA